MEGQIRSTHRRFCLAKLVSFDHSSDAHVIDAALRNLFDAHHSSPPAYECTRDLRTLPGRHNRKSDFHSYSEPPADPEVKAMSRNITCSSQDWPQLLRIGLEPDFDLKF